MTNNKKEIAFGNLFFIYNLKDSYPRFLKVTSEISNFWSFK